MKKTLLLLFILISLCSHAQQLIDTGGYKMDKSRFGGYYFHFLNETEIIFKAFSCMENSTGKGTYTINDTQLVMTFTKHPDDTINTSISVQYSEIPRKDSIEVLLKCISPEITSPLDLYKIIIPDVDTLNFWLADTVDFSFKFKIPVNKLPCPVLSYSRNRDNPFTTIISLPFDAKVTISTSLSEHMGWPSPYINGGTITLNIENVSPQGFTLLLGEHRENAYKVGFIKHVKQ